MKSLAHSKRYNEAEFRELCSVRDTGGTETFHDIFKTVLMVASSPWKPADSSGYTGSLLWNKKVWSKVTS